MTHGTNGTNGAQLFRVVGTDVLLHIPERSLLFSRMRETGKPRKLQDER